MQDYIPKQIDINGKIGTIFVKQFDNLSRYIHLQIMDNDLSSPMNLVGCEVRLYADLINDIGFIDGEVADGEKGIITFLLPNGLTQKQGEYEAEIWITNAEEGSTITTKPFIISVDKTLRDERRLEATGQFSALENALFRVATDKARINNLIASLAGGTGESGGADSEVLDIRTAYDGTLYNTAGDAVRGQIQEIHDSVATTAEFLSVIGGDYDENEEVAKLISGLQAVLEEANSFKWQIKTINREIQNITTHLPDSSITIDKLSPALQNPDNVISSGTVSEMLWCAESYFNHAYTGNGKDSGMIYESHAGLYSESLGKNAANQQYSIVCSSFADAILNGISFQNSRYNGKSKNTPSDWGIVFDDTGVFGTTYDGQTAEDKALLQETKYLSSQNLALYAAEHGYLYANDGNHSVRAGDVLFSGNKTDRYLGIDHVSLVINADKTYCTLLEAWPAKKTDIDGTQHDIGLRVNYHASLSDYTYGATFPLGDVENEPIVLESTYDISGTTVQGQTTVHEFRNNVSKGFYTVVCHGSFDKTPYISLKYGDSENSTYLGDMLRVGSNYYATIYAEQSATVLVRMVAGNDYEAQEISLFSGYADITTQNLKSTAQRTCTIESAWKLKPGNDLNDCKVGIWFCQNTETAQAISNAPMGAAAQAGFRMESVQMTESERYLQTVWYAGVPDKMYVRMYSSAGWTSWVVYSGTAI